MGSSTLEQYTPSFKWTPVNMKVKTIARSTLANTRERASDNYIERHNPSPSIHPFQRAREYQRALNATKLDRLFAKPFVAGMDGHVEGVYCLERHGEDLKFAVSGSADGEVRVWNVSQRRCVWSERSAHESFVRAVSFIDGGDHLQVVSGGDDRMIKLWTVNREDGSLLDRQELSREHVVTSIDHSVWNGRGVFATAGDSVDVWQSGRGDPIQSLRFGQDTIQAVRFNKAQPDLLAATCSDRSILLYDLRADCMSPIHRTVLRMRSNAVSWNPMETFYFAVANEDHRSYVFDMRYMKEACNVLTGHVSAVMDIDYAPTGQEIVTGAYDRTIRIYKARHGTSRDVYHTSRMQRVFSVRYTADAQYILSGSDEGVVRLWRAEASRRPGPKTARQTASIDYANALRERFSTLPEIRRISSHRHLPKEVKNSARVERIQMESKARRQANIRAHSKPGTGAEPLSVRKQPIISDE